MWEKFIYALALAFWRAYFDALRESQRATEEIPNAEDRARADRIRDAVARLPLPPHPDNPRPDDPAPGSGGGPGEGLGP